MQAIKTPIANDSRHTRPFNLAPPDALKNLAKNASNVTATTYAHAIPVSSNPRSVFRPDSVKYSGRKSAPIRSSSFSMIIILKRCSRGRMRPTMKPPKMAWTPMMAVKKAEARATRRIRAMMLCEGPFSMLPVRRKSQLSPGLTA